ncbi:hypothetical protein BQ8482_380076 [Mesorhizobium delmotii]|uniref:Uncharacterized protein n=1 Tax=Mesorhizobium delmotii TaxID=1631247 RepID=A0A2P9AS07_9HYPH|nr:hypothetical protein BQ8482_380076 [Mesorhizobium delmotii]
MQMRMICISIKRIVSQSTRNRIYSGRGRRQIDVVRICSLQATNGNNHFASRLTFMLLLAKSTAGHVEQSTKTDLERRLPHELPTLNERVSNDR